MFKNIVQKGHEQVYKSFQEISVKLFCHKNLVKLKGYAESRFSGQSHSSCRGDLSSQRSKVTSYKVRWVQLWSFGLLLIMKFCLLKKNQ